MPRWTLLISMLVLLASTLFAGGIQRVGHAQETTPRPVELPTIAVAFGDGWSRCVSRRSSN